MDDNKMTASEFAKWCEIQTWEFNKKIRTLGLGLGFILLYKALKSNNTKI